jgi:hypothetical protein
MPMAAPGAARDQVLKQLEGAFVLARDLRAVQVSARRSVNIADMTGTELVGEAVARNSVPLGLYQVALGSKDMVYVIFASAPKAQMEQYLVEFRKMAESLTLTTK